MVALVCSSMSDYLLGYILLLGSPEDAAAPSLMGCRVLYLDAALNWGAACAPRLMYPAYCLQVHVKRSLGAYV